MPDWEANFDGLVGPTHNFAGLAFGNLASMKNRQRTSQPRSAALEGLRKMKVLLTMGIPQAVLPPHERPDLDLLRRAGFTGTASRIIDTAYHRAPELLAASYSASSMWTANAATVSPSADTADGRIHVTPANLVSQLHRSIEPDQTTRLLRKIFSNSQHFVVHEPLPAGGFFRDEGAANHTRLCQAYGEPGIEIFAYGCPAHGSSAARVFPARQTLEASQAVARLHRLDPDRTLFIQQHPDAIDAGAFHNDVVSVGNGPVLLYHERAFADGQNAVQRIEQVFASLPGGRPQLIVAREAQVSLADAIATYLFNSQLVSHANGSMSLIAPLECHECDTVRRWIERLLEENNPIDSVHYVDVRQSMANGGGPACLRLRVVMNDRQLQSVHRDVMLDGPRLAQLETWVRTYYRDLLKPSDLRDPELLCESRAALDVLTQILCLGSIYSFQQSGRHRE